MARISPNDLHPLKGRPDPLRKGRDLAMFQLPQPHAAEQQRISRRTESPEHLCLRCHKKTMWTMSGT